MRKYAVLPFQDTAVGYYRLIQPARFLKRLKIVRESRTLPFTGESQTQHYRWNDRTYMEICDGADVLHTTLLATEDDILKCLNLRHYFGLKWVVDLDDNIWASSPDNPASAQAETFRPIREQCLSLADGVTVSVPSLREIVGQLNPNVFVQPNGLDFKVWDKLKVTPKKKLRIGWRGAYGHKEDLELIRPVIMKMKEAYPGLEFVTFGWDPGFSDEHHGWTSFQKYPEKLASLGIDAALVPLVDSAYNRCKSNIGWLEWSALSIPCVYSETENHKKLPGMPCSTPYEWFQALDRLLSDPALRKERGTEQNLFAKKFFNMKDLAPPLASWFDALPRRIDLEP